MTKEEIIKKYRAGLYNPNMDMVKYNKSMYPSINSGERLKGHRYYLYPAYIDITDLFTAKEEFENFYVGDIMELDFTGEFKNDKPEDYFGTDWNPITGNGEWN